MESTSPWADRATHLPQGRRDLFARRGLLQFIDTMPGPSEVGIEEAQEFTREQWDALVLRVGPSEGGCFPSTQPLETEKGTRDRDGGVPPNTILKP